jgi:undecaprenyl-diphosphatase
MPENMHFMNHSSRLRRNFVICPLLLAAFFLIAYLITGQNCLTQVDEQLGQELCENRQKMPQIKALFVGITFLGSPAALTVFAILIAVSLLNSRSYTLLIIWVISMVGCAIIDANVKHLFSRDRPSFKDPAVYEDTKSFPSGHSMGSLVGYGFLAVILSRNLPRGRWQVAVSLALAVLVLVIGFSRIFLGAHFFSDVVGGFTLGGAWLGACLAVFGMVQKNPLEGRTAFNSMHRLEEAL